MPKWQIWILKKFGVKFGPIAQYAEPWPDPPPRAKWGNSGHMRDCAQCPQAKGERR